MIVKNVSQEVVKPYLGFKLYPGSSFSLDLSYLEKEYCWITRWALLSELQIAGKLEITPSDYSFTYTMPAVENVPDSPAPILVWLNVDQVKVCLPEGFAKPGCLTLADGIRRSLPDNLLFDLRVLGEGGLLVGTRAPSTQYFLYTTPARLVPSSLTVFGCLENPQVGPAFSLYKYIGFVQTDEEGNLTLTGTQLV